MVSSYLHSIKAQILGAHQAAVDLSFSAIALDAASLGKSNGSQINKNHVLKIFGRGLSEIGAPLTPGVSLGTKILVSKIFPFDKNKIIFYKDFGFMW